MVIHFLDVASLKVKSAPKSYDQMKKEFDSKDLSTKKKSESFDKNWHNGGCFSKIFTLAPPNSYTINLKRLTKVLKAFIWNISYFKTFPEMSFSFLKSRISW